jgi:hypothetical protein
VGDRRINMNCARTSTGQWSVLPLPDARGERPFFAFAPVQTDKTAELLRELRVGCRASSAAAGERRGPTA